MERLTESVMVRLTPSQMRQAQKVAEREERKLSNLARIALKRYVENAERAGRGEGVQGEK